MASFQTNTVYAVKYQIYYLFLNFVPSQMWAGLVNEALRGEGEGGEESPDPLVTMETQLKVLQICANIVNYCRTAMTMGGQLYMHVQYTCTCMFIHSGICIIILCTCIYIVLHMFTECMESCTLYIHCTCTLNVVMLLCLLVHM